MKYVKLMPGRSLVYASRNRRELSLAQEYGYEVIVISSDFPEIIYGIDKNYCAVPDRLAKLDESIFWLKRFLIIILEMLTLSRRIAKLNADILSCHDLSGLLIGWLSTWFVSNRKRAKLIYDSHEFELGRNTKRSRFQYLAIKYLERFLINRCVFSIMVNDTIADEVMRIHRLKKRPVVVRSTPNLWCLNNSETAKVHSMFCKLLDIPDDSFIAMYHGGIIPGRSIETLIRLVAENKNISAVILGAGESEYLIQL